MHFGKNLAAGGLENPLGKINEGKILLLQFARYSLIVRAVLQGAAPAERCHWQSGFTRKGLHLCGLWAFVSLPATAALKGSKMRSRKAARVGKESFSSLAEVCEKTVGNWQIA